MSLMHRLFMTHFLSDPLLWLLLIAISRVNLSFVDVTPNTCVYVAFGSLRSMKNKTYSNSEWIIYGRISQSGVREPLEVS